MNKTKLIPFDLERWKAGDFKRVVTKEGKEVSELTYFGSATKDTWPLVGVLEKDVQSWTIDGTFFNIERNSQSILMLEVEDKTLEGWVNVYEDEFGPSVHETKAMANLFKNKEKNYITTIKITYPNDNN
jgi:hypothetical protein